MRFSDIRQPVLFQRLVHRLYVAEYGQSLQVVDDSAGDRGNDGYDPERGLLLAIYCPEKDLTAAKALTKARSDLVKAARLMAEPGYEFSEWIFVTPVPLPEKVQATLRCEAESAGLTAQFMSGIHLEDIYLRHTELRDVFPELDYPRIEAELKAINSKLDSLAADPSGATAPSSSLPASDEYEPADTHYSAQLSIGFGSAQLAELQRRLHDGDAEAGFELERFRLESVNCTDAAAAIMIQIEAAIEAFDFPRVVELGKEGGRLASRNGMKAEEAVFLAREAHAETLLLSKREMDFNSKLAFSIAGGIPLLSLDEAREFDSRSPREHDRLETQFRRAYQLAQESRNLESIFQVAIFGAMAATQSSYPERILLDVAHKEEVRPRIEFYRKRMESSYGLAISAASALQSDRHLSIAYSNLANDLVAFGDLDRALSHATYARRIADRMGDENQIVRTRLILEAIERRKQGDGAVS
jgi:hypothetical protein